MSIVLRRHIPLLITFVTGIIMILAYYVSSDVTLFYKTLPDTLVAWRAVLGTIVFIGTINLLRVHGRNVSKRRPGQWYYSAWLVILIVVYAVLGLALGPTSKSYRWLIDNVTVPITSTMYASLCFYMAAGAYRVLRARSWETLFLLLTAFLVIMGNTPLIAAKAPVFFDTRQWIFKVIVVGSYRAIRIGVGLGAVAVGLKTVFGLETAYLGRR